MDQYGSKWIFLCHGLDWCHPQSTLVQVESRTHGLDLFGLSIGVGRVFGTQERGGEGLLRETSCRRWVANLVNQPVTAHQHGHSKYLSVRWAALKAGAEVGI